MTTTPPSLIQDPPAEKTATVSPKPQTPVVDPTSTVETRVEIPTSPEKIVAQPTISPIPIAQKAPVKKEIENTKPEAKKTGFFGQLSEKWKAHVAKNKQNAQKNKVENKDLNAKISKNVSLSNSEVEIFVENFDPERDRKKLTKELRAKIRESEKFYKEGVVNIKDLIAPSSMEITPRGMQLNDKFVRSFYVFNYPRYLESNWLNQIINYDSTFDISFFVYPADSSRMMRILRKKVTEMMATKHMRDRKGITSDPALETALEDAEQLRVDLQRGTERFFQLGLYFTIYADSKEKLDTVSKQVETILGGLLVMTRAADFQTERAFNSTLPQATDEMYHVRNMNTGPLSTTFPFVSSSLTSNEGLLYGLNRHNNSLIIFDRFNLENANSVIFAKSGAGKSYAVKLEVLRSMMMGTDVIILDPEREYETLTNTIGGSYINISINSQHRINPFDLPIPIDEESSNTVTLLRENIITLLGLMNLMLGKMNPQEESLMEKALFQSYEIKGITERTKNPHEFEMPTMNDLYHILDSMEGGKDLAIRLEKYTEGTFSGLFSDQTNVDLKSGLVAFCIRDLEDRLRPISMHILLNYIWNRVRSDLKRRLLIIDEAWNIVQYEDSGRFLHNLCKRARKYYLGIATITQDVEDFMDSPWGKPIITNSSMQLLLKQAPSAMEKLQKVFNLTEQEKYLLLNSSVGQGLFFAGNQHVAIQVIASYGEHKIVTTNPKEILERNKA
jgi:conjugal transfer ATP-binding protein TraC